MIFKQRMFHFITKFKTSFFNKELLKIFATTIDADIENDVTENTTHLIVESGK